MKSPFTPQGVEDKLVVLYALPDGDLAIEAAAIKTNFKDWVKNNFTLSTAQVGYIDDIDTKTSEYYGEQCSFCFTNRLDIILIYPEPPEPPGYAKWTGSSNNIEVKTDGAGNNVVAGSFTFTISYS